MRRRSLLMAALAVACIAAAIIYVVMSVSSSPDSQSAENPGAVRLPHTPYIVFRSLDRADAANYGRIAVLPLSNLDGPRQLGGLVCERVDFSGSSGICLEVADGFPLSYRARLLGPDLRPTGSVAIAGFPSRARVSADGRLGAVTTFVSGHSYADLGVFSTKTTIIDMERGSPAIENLEELPVTRDGKRIDSADHNLWGVTFAPHGDTFYATLATGGTTYLVRGSARDRALKVIRANAECPSLSPDASRVVYKKRTGADGLWRLTVLDLGTMVETPLAEGQPIDDQVEWLDENTILYRNGEATWSVPAAGSGAPARFLPGADSPSIVRETGSEEPTAK